MACKSTCETCIGFPACVTCPTNYVKFGGACLYYKNIQSDVTFSALGSWYDGSGNSSDISNQNIANALLNINGIINAFMQAADIQNTDQIIANSLTSGSIRTNMVLAADPNQDFPTFTQGYQNNLDNKNVAGLNVISSSNTVNNQDTAV